jgi:integrase
MAARNKLTDAKVKAAALAKGRYSDGGGLYLNVAKAGSKSWLFMWVRDGKRVEMGLGGYPAVTLAAARTRAERCREMVAQGIDPRAEREQPTIPTFAACVDQFLGSMEASWRNEKHRAQWRMTLTVYAEPIANRLVSDIGTDEVLAVLNPIWRTKPETASRLRGRLERILDFAKARGWRMGENPALWRGHLKTILPPRQKLSRGHHAAMPYTEVPSFMKRLAGSEAMAARALEFLIFTAGRSGEVLNATWNEVDLEAGVWTIPAARMKASKLHRVPLSRQAAQLLTQLSAHKLSEYVFTGFREGRPLSATAMEMLLRRMKSDEYTAHGFRSAFRDWAGDQSDYPREVAEAALAHRVGDATEQAYRRSDALERRRGLMQEWADYVLPSTNRAESDAPWERY